MNQYLVISRGQWDRHAQPAEIQTAIDEFYTWLDQLVAAGKMKTGQRLANQGRTVARNSKPTDGPFGEAKEVVGGYWFILAANLDEAAAIACGNPCLKHGLFYEIRPIEPARACAFEPMTETPRA